VPGLRLHASLVFLFACSPDFSVPESHRAVELVVEAEPLGRLDEAPPVFRLRVRGGLSRAPLADFRLFEGSLSSLHLGRLRKRDLPKTLLDREIAVVTWSDGPDVVVAPTRALSAGTVSLAAADLGLLAEVTVEPDLVPWVPRIWPPEGALSGAGLSVYCGWAASLIEAGAVLLAPGGVEASIESGLDDRESFGVECVRIEPSVEAHVGALLLPPPLAGGAAFEPLPLIVSESPVAPPTCEAPEVPLGPACALPGDDRVVLRAAAGRSLWAIQEPEVTLGVTSPGDSLVVRGFEPETEPRLVATVFDESGARSVIDQPMILGPSVCHVVINEVLSDPRGPEPQGEWVELYNDGAEVVNLSGFTLVDTGGAIELPAHELLPGEFALLVSDEFLPDPELDVLPPADAALLRVGTVGVRGLGNTGEALRLVDPEGVVVSRFPSLPSPDPGTSLARVRPDAVDGEASSFQAHAAPGASPGAPNASLATAPP
jgi:hypothetical protein